MKKIARSLIFSLALTGAAMSASAQMKSGDVDIFAGLDFSYRDILYNGRPFDLLLNLTPGVKWNMGKRWEIAAAASIPVINQYGGTYSYIKIYTAAVSKQIAVGKRWRTKFSGGIFTLSRFGVDIKSQYQIKPWLAIDAQIGVTGQLTMDKTWSASPMSRVSFLVGPEFWIGKYTTQFTARGGRFVYGDYGAVIDGMRHFKHASVGLYGQYSNVGKYSGGFKIVIMIPPYKRSCRRVHWRPASNFRLTFCSESSSLSNKMYAIDPEQNERQGWFDRDLLPWGPDTMAPDFKPCDPEAEAAKRAGKDIEETVVVSTEEVNVVNQAGEGPDR